MRVRGDQVVSAVFFLAEARNGMGAAQRDLVAPLGHARVADECLYVHGLVIGIANTINAPAFSASIPKTADSAATSSGSSRVAPGSSKGARPAST